MINKNCICITAMARHRCPYSNEATEGCDRPDYESPSPIKVSTIISHKKQKTMLVNKDTVHELDADQLSDAITTGKAKVDIQDIETAVNLVSKLLEALAGRKQLRRRVDVLENIVAGQQKVLDMLTAKL